MCVYYEQYVAYGFFRLLLVQLLSLLLLLSPSSMVAGGSSSTLADFASTAERKAETLWHHYCRQDWPALSFLMVTLFPLLP